MADPRLPLQGDLFAQCQRWRNGRASYRPAGELFDPSTAEVVVLDDDRTAKRFVCDHHYSGSYPAAKFRVGLFTKRQFEKEELSGTAVFSVPRGAAVVPAWYTDLRPDQGVELGRFVLLDHLAANAETWFQARALRALRRAFPAIKAVVSFCDPVERTSTDGQVIKRGHVGTVYSAGGAQRLGRSKPRTLRLMPNGLVASERALSKLRNDECGAAYALRQLIAAGAPSRRLFEAADDYLRRLEEERFFRLVRHPGNVVFGWRL
jgi:hypothetical protein